MHVGCVYIVYTPHKSHTRKKDHGSFSGLALGVSIWYMYVADFFARPMGTGKRYNAKSKPPHSVSDSVQIANSEQAGDSR